MSIEKEPNSNTNEIVDYEIRNQTDKEKFD